MNIISYTEAANPTPMPTPYPELRYKKRKHKINYEISSMIDNRVIDW